MEYSEIIDENLSMIDVIKQYTDILPKKNRIPCPFHGGINYNLGFNKVTFHCFVCGENGNIISFVEKMFGLNFKQTVLKLNNDFGLGLNFPKKITVRERQVLINAKKERDKRLLLEEEALENAKIEYYWISKDFNRLYENKIKYKPKEICTELHPLYIEALQNISYTEYLLDQLLKEWGDKIFE